MHIVATKNRLLYHLNFLVRWFLEFCQYRSRSSSFMFFVFRALQNRFGHRPKVFESLCLHTPSPRPALLLTNRPSATECQPKCEIDIHIHARPDYFVTYRDLFSRVENFHQTDVKLKWAIVLISHLVHVWYTVDGAVVCGWKRLKEKRHHRRTPGGARFGAGEENCCSNGNN